MVKTIKLLDNYARLVESEPFLMPDKLIVRFIHQGYDLSNAFVTVKNGTKIEKYKFANPFVIPSEFLFAGDLYIKVEMYLGGEKAKQWTTLPIRIMETATSLIAYDLLSSLENEIKTIKEDYVSKEKYLLVVEKLNEIAKKQNEIADTVSVIKEDSIKINI